MEKQLIKPAAIEHQKYPLCGLDLVFGFHYVDVVWFLRKDYDIAVLEPALRKTVDCIPVLAGKIIKEDGRFVLDTDGHGVEISFETAAQPAPDHDEMVFPISGYDFFNAVPQIINTDIAEMPLLTVKVTTFSDGIICVGIRHSHALMDGTASHFFTSMWIDHINGIAPTPLSFSRDVVLALANRESPLPSAQSGIAVSNGQLAAPAPQFFQNRFHTLEIGTDFERLLNLAKTKFKGIVSINHLMHALLFKAFGLSSKQPDADTAKANLPYDVRFVKGTELPFSFFGNAVLFRCLELSFSELRAIDLLSLAQRFKLLSQSDMAATSQDIGFYQSQYEQESYNKSGVYTNFSPVPGNGGLYINNMLRLLDDPVDTNFGGRLLRADVVLPREFGVRSAILMPSATRRAVLRLALETQQISAFEKSWPELVSALVEGPIPAAV